MSSPEKTLTHAPPESANTSTTEPLNNEPSITETSTTETSMTEPLAFETLQLHAGQEHSDALTKARAVPIYATSSYTFDSADHAEALFAGEVTGNQYGRMHNPTVDAFVKRLVALERGLAGVALSSGQAATTVTLMSLVTPGSHVILSNQLFGGTYSVINKILAPWGVEVSIVPPTALPSLRSCKITPWQFGVKPSPTLVAAYRTLLPSLTCVRVTSPWLSITPGVAGDTCANRSPWVRTSWCTRRPSGLAVTGRLLVGQWSMGVISTGQLASFRCLPNRRVKVGVT